MMNIIRRTHIAFMRRRSRRIYIARWLTSQTGHGVSVSAAGERTLIVKVYRSSNPRSYYIDCTSTKEDILLRIKE